MRPLLCCGGGADWEVALSAVDAGGASYLNATAAAIVDSGTSVIVGPTEQVCCMPASMGGGVVGGGGGEARAHAPRRCAAHAAFLLALCLRVCI